MASQKTVAISSCSGTSPAVHAAKLLLESAECRVTIYSDGREMEAAILAGQIDAVLDLTTAELASISAGPDRMTAAALKGLPQVLSLGGLDTIDGQLTTPEINDKVGQDFAQKACAARGPTAILIPLRGLSHHENPEGNSALFQSVRNWVYGVELIEVDAHINDAVFAKLAVETLLMLTAKS